MTRPRSGVRGLLVWLAGAGVMASASAQQSPTASDPVARATRFVYEERAGDERRIVEYVAAAQRAVTLGRDGVVAAIYDRGDDAIWLAQPGDASVQTLDRASARRMAALIDEQMDRLEAQWQQLPPEQAARARADLRRLLSTSPATESVARAVATGEQGSVAGHACAYFRLESMEGEVGRACIAEAGSFDFDQPLIDMLRLVADVFRTLGEAGGETLGGKVLGAPLLPGEALTGLPLSVAITDTDGRVLRGLELQGVRYEDVSAEFLALPGRRD